MTKLVTGIEAIQSGRPWKHKDDDKWISTIDRLGVLSSMDLLKREFIIKEEPREFWIDISIPTCIQMYPIDYFGVDFSGDNWIRVREVDK